MRLRDIKVGSKLKIALACILALVLIIGATAWIQTTSMWRETKGLYDHPFAVRWAVGELKADVLAMHQWTQDLILSHREPDHWAILHNIGLNETDALQRFDTIFDRYLGPREDIEEARNAFLQWKAVRDETTRLVREGRTDEAASRVGSSGINSAAVNNVLAAIKKVSDFANNRANQYYADAQHQKDVLLTRLLILVCIILFLSLVIAYYLLASIRAPLEELSLAAEQYRRGNFDARSRYEAGNEFGMLSVSFNNLAETVQAEMKSRENAARITEVMLKEEEPRAFCHNLLSALMEHSGSQVGAVYLLNEEKTGFDHFVSIGLATPGRPSFSVSEHEGEFGMALSSRQICRVSEIPRDTRFIYSTVTGDFRPREIITIPILAGRNVTAMVSLASVREYSSAALRLVEDVWNMLAARLNGVLLFRQIRRLARKLEAQNRELESQARQLSAQTDELTEQNVELETQKRQLDEANQLKSRFLSNMSHELRTPLNSVIALSGVLNRRLQGAIPEEEYGYLDVIERNGKSLLSLINDILDLSRVEAGREEVSISRFSPRNLVNEVVAMIEPQAKEKGLALLNSVDGDLTSISSDFHKCWHILQNILSNAVKFTDTGHVEISADQVEGGIRIHVADTGIGIIADQLPHIFDEFRQADDSMSRRYGGAGLGLAIARKYALLLQGSLTVESVPGQGSTFTLTLPSTFDESQQTIDEITPDFSGWRGPLLDGRGKTVLLVEDSEPAIIQVTDILVGQGYLVHVARNGRDALEIAIEKKPNAMILDLMMPEVDGFQVLRMIRNEEQTARLPVLILTAKHVTREELAFLKGNCIHQLIRKGDINKTELLRAIGGMACPPEKIPATQPVKPVRPKSSGKPVILVVEDNPDNLTTVKAVLKDVAEVIDAADGLTGVELARRHRPDLILMDISLPVLDGLDALNAIRNDETLRRVPVIALTASAMKGDREEILAHGFDAYIAKPLDADLLLNTIREMMDAHE